MNARIWCLCGRVLTMVLLILTSLPVSADKEGLKVLASERELHLEGIVSTELDRYQEELKGAIEYLACAKGGKEYESLIVLKASPQSIYDAIVQLGAKPGKPAYDDETGKHVPPKGDPIRIWIEWKEGNASRRVRAETLVVQRKRHQPLKPMDWVFTGSRLTWSLDEDSDEQVLEATILKNIISLHHADPSVLIQNPLEEAVQDNLYAKNDALLPKPGTPVTLILQIHPKEEERR